MARKDTAKLVAHAQRQRELNKAKKTSSGFGASQSKFVRNEEEKQIASDIGADSKFAFEQARRKAAASAAHSGQGAKVSSRQMRANRFALNEVKRSREDDEAAATGGLLGASTLNFDNNDDGDTLPTKAAKKDRFEEVISDNRRKRVQAQKDREEREQETVALDADFALVQHLLTKRDKRQEDIDEFNMSGTAEVRALLANHREQRGAGTSRQLRIGDDGDVAKVVKVEGKSTSVVHTNKAPAALDDEDRKLLAKITHAPVREVGKAAPAPPAAAEPEQSKFPVLAVEDDFDMMMGSMRREVKKAHAGERTLDEEEEAAAEEKRRKEQHLRSLPEMVDTDSAGLTRRELLVQGGDAVHRMDADDPDNIDVEDLDYDDEYDDEEREETKASKTQQGHALDALIVELEDLANNGTGGEEDEAKFEALLSKMYPVVCKHTKHATETFRLLLIEAYRLQSKGEDQTRMTLLSIVACSQLFPLTDYRHPITTPLTILLSAVLAQIELTSLERVKTGLMLASLLVHILLSSRRHCGEVVAFCLNVISLMLNRTAMQPKANSPIRVPFALLERPAEALLSKSRVPKKAALSEEPLRILDTSEPSPVNLLRVAYTLLMHIVDSYKTNAGIISGVVEPFEKLVALIDRERDIPSAILSVHDATLQKMADVRASCTAMRTPLAMRTFRTAPLRQFDPMLVETTEDGGKRELREMKKEMRDERKRVVRHVQAEATVERRAREKAATTDAARRQDKLNKIMGELQAQQHIMKTVDNFRNKAKDKKKKSLSGAAGNSGGGEGGDE